METKTAIRKDGKASFQSQKCRELSVAGNVLNMSKYFKVYVFFIIYFLLNNTLLEDT